MTTKRREQERQVKKRTDQKRKDHTIYVARHSPPLARLCSTGILCFYEGMALICFNDVCVVSLRGPSRWFCWAFQVQVQRLHAICAGSETWTGFSASILSLHVKCHLDSGSPCRCISSQSTQKRTGFWTQSACRGCWTPKMDLEDLVQDFSIEKCTDLHASAGGVTTQGVAVRGANRGRRDAVTSYLSVLQWLGRCRNQCLHDVMWATHVTCIHLLQMLDYSKLLQMVKCFALLQVESKNITTESGQAMPSVQKLSLGVIVVITWSRVLTYKYSQLQANLLRCQLCISLAPSLCHNSLRWNDVTESFLFHHFYLSDFSCHLLSS